MRARLAGLLIAIMIFGVWGSAQAAERNFQAGSLIIPMDQFYQPDTDNGILEAYGLVYYLLAHTDETGENDISVYWIINELKTAIDAKDFVIENTTLKSGQAVAKKCDHAGGATELAFRTGDNAKRISYLGAPWIVDARDAAKARAIIDQPGWAAVDVHVAEVPFKAPVHRELRGTPPKIALMNSNESSEGGNAAILEAYLRLAGICTNVYEVVTPNQIRDGILNQRTYDFLWAPHWHGNKSDGNRNGEPDDQEIVKRIGDYLLQGNGLLAECASIKVFEQHGRFLSTQNIGEYNKGSTRSSDMVYNVKISAFPQIGDFQFAPAGGALHNWRAVSLPEHYNQTVTRFTTDKKGWDFYVGGYAFGDRNNGYVVYLGGHMYAHCGKASGVILDPEPHLHPMMFGFAKDIDSETFTLTVAYNGGSVSEITFGKLDLGQPVTGGTGSLRFDLKAASVYNTTIEDIIFKNTSSTPITIDSITFSWSGGLPDQKLKSIVNNKTDAILYESTVGVGSGSKVSITGMTIPEYDPSIVLGGCSNNDGCRAVNIAGVRYVLNTLFNIKYKATNREYVRSAAIVSHPYLYQGTFEYPSYRGHFRRLDVTRATKSVGWDTAAGRIPPAFENNTSPSARQVFTSKKNTNGTWSMVPFDSINIDTLRVPLNVTPTNGKDDDEFDVINRIRGKTYKSGTGWVESTNKLGGIMHSAPAIVGAKNRAGASRSETAYVGDLYGMLHAIDTSSGTEKWAYIPNNLLSKLKNNRTDPNANHDFAGVDGSPTVRDVYFDHDGNGAKEWRTVLVSAEGRGGKSIFALDVTDPNHWSVMWETTDADAPGGGMGHSHSVAIDKVKWPIRDANNRILRYEIKWVVFLAAGYAQVPVVLGGINVFAFDLKTGAKLWTFSSQYADSVNDIPGVVAAYDTDRDSFADRVYVGDMNGRLWELNALDGTNPNGAQVDGTDAGKQIPLFNAGIGNPISVLPAVITHDNHTIVVFGTGGADWASDAATYAIYAVDATATRSTPNYASGAGTLLWQYNLSSGEKVWSSPTIAAGEDGRRRVYVATSFGSMESGDPGQDVDQGGGNLLCLNLGNGTLDWRINNIGKVRGSLYLDRKHLYLTTLDNQVIQIGGEDFGGGKGSRPAVLRSWKQF